MEIVYHLEYMDALQKRILLFLFGCITVRTLFVYLAYGASSKWLKIYGYLALLPAIGFLYIFMSGSRKTGGETFGAPIWWNYIRPVHSLLYFAFAWNAICENKNSWMYLAADVVLGLVSFILHHVLGMNFS
jgi:hypothetical protein